MKVSKHANQYGNQTWTEEQLIELAPKARSMFNLLTMLGVSSGGGSWISVQKRFYRGDSYEDAGSLIGIDGRTLIFEQYHRGPDGESRKIVRRMIPEEASDDG